MNLTLNPQLSRLIEDGVQSGRFATPEDLIAAGVSRVLAESDLSAEELGDLRIDAQIGLEQADRGEFASFTALDIINQGKAILAKRASEQAT